MYSLDVETSAINGGDADAFGLEPWRVYQGTATITVISVAGPDGYQKILKDLDELPNLLKELAGKRVFAHNAKFDAAWLIAHTDYDLVNTIKWEDTSLLAKWVMNSQMTEKRTWSYSLKHLVGHFLPDDPMTEEFLDVKTEVHVPGQDQDYWDKRVVMDAVLTLKLAHHLLGLLPESMVRGYTIEQRCIASVARSWLDGILLDGDQAQSMTPDIREGQAKILKKLDLPSTVITSPKQLGEYMFNTLGLQPKNFSSKTGAPSTAQDDIKLLHSDLALTNQTELAGKLEAILEFKHLKTLETKFIKGVVTSAEYNLDGTTHPSPNMFGTYTSRFTYSAKNLKKYPTGVAIHQMPRKGPVRTFIKPLPGYKLAEFDAAGQESRLMAIMSGDENMLKVFEDGLDFHSMTGSRISGIEYSEFVERFHQGDKDVVNHRYNGKFVNLSCNYRIGNQALARKAFTQYGLSIDVATAAQWNNVFKTSYPGVVKYWDRIVTRSKRLGYTETLAGKRYYLDEWGQHEWVTSSSAINFPIQGSGSDMKELAIAMVAQKFPEAHFAFDVHDALFMYLPDNDGVVDLATDIKRCLNNLPYAEAWQRDIPIPLLWDAALGTSWGDMKEIDY